MDLEKWGKLIEISRISLSFTIWTLVVTVAISSPYILIFSNAGLRMKIKFVCAEFQFERL